MSGKITDTTVPSQVENTIRQLDSLSMLPCVAARFLSQLNQFQLSPPALDELIESDPALSVKIFTIFHQQGLSFPEGNSTIRQALDRLSFRAVRDAFFSVKVYQAPEQQEQRVLLRKQLLLHSLAVACCAKDIAEITPGLIEPQLAYSAGLLHNIGNLALDQVMPRSFASIIEEAKSQGVSICTVQQKHLGLDYTILGKRLAQKWHLPNEITLAIWLHRSNTEVISQNMPEARIAQIVQLADSMARQCGIGQSGSFDSYDLPKAVAGSLAITPEQLEQIGRNLSEEVRRKSEVLGLDLPEPEQTYFDVVNIAAAQLAQESTELLLENRRLQTASSYFDFITDFLPSITSAVGAIDIAENFAVRWQKFYQTGPVCLYLVPPVKSQTLEAVLVESQSRTKTIVLKTPAQTPAIPQQASKGFVILNAHDHADWLFEQLGMDFDATQTKLMPLLSNGKAVGAIVFQLRYPVETEKLQEKFKAVTSVAGAILDMAFASADRQRFAEQFAHLLAKPADRQIRIDTGYSLSALAEIAAGAAHELNNPLSVISGRAQLFSQTEADPEKRQILKQIQESTDELSKIIDGLMSFAQPQPPRPTEINIRQILDEATQLTAQKNNIEQLDVQIDIAENSKNVFVDSAQIASAIANIFSNSLESYTDGRGPIKINAAADQSGNFVKLQISDYGCGMDRQTLQKATQPFFSAKPAGRKRGMGLAYANRIIQLNNGMLGITSEPGSGTTVTISLPRK